VPIASPLLATAVAYAPSVAELLSFEDALARVLERAPPLPTEVVPAAEWMGPPGRVVGEDVVAATDLPPFPSSAMDGFAVRSADTPGRLPVSFRIAAGLPAPGSLEAGRAMGIATGGVVPEGADAVVPVEYVVDHGNEVEISEPVVRGANVRPRGGDLAAGEPVVSRGTVLGPAHIGALAASGVAEARCGCRPVVAVLVTGSELQSPGRPLRPGQIYEANGTILGAQVRTAGGEVAVSQVVEDTDDAHRGALAAALDDGVDLVLTSGGVSVGPHDLVRRVAADLGVEEAFWGVAVRPGKPLFFGVRERTLVFGLPGNPVSSLVGFELFVRPAMLALQGAAEPSPPFETGTLARTVPKNANRDTFVRARRSTEPNGPALMPLSGQESHMIGRAAGADSLLLVPRGKGDVAAGAAVRYLRLD
jgi:molybdopterin molybdotransferase